MELHVSVQRYDTDDGARWRVRWREHDGRMRSRSVTSKREALALDADVKARRFKGEALPRATRDTLADAYAEWLRLRGSRLAPQTLQVYRYVWNAHVRGPGFDAHRLTDLVSDPMLIEELTAGMKERGVGPSSQRKTLVVLSAVLTAAVEWKKIPTNPVWRMRKPPGTRQRHPHPFPPLVVERIKLRMQRRPTRRGDPYRGSGDACIVGLLSYAGLRPGEALALTWEDIGQRTLAVDKAVADGVVGSTKTGQSRTVPLVEPLRQELEVWQALSGAASGGLVFPGPDSGPWSRSQANNWRGRVWRPAVEDLARETGLERLARAIPYDCRGSFVSLHLRAGASPLEVAAWAGHSPQVMFKHYANVIEELVGEPRLAAEEQIHRARAAVQDRPQNELDRLMMDLYENPTLSSPGTSCASIIFYEPGDGPS